ncbi:hypothetical protein J2X47_000023 [Sphingomonas sp. BE270]|jgi:hypothetical protein|nr:MULTISPECIES: hypothetical protein [unclassified Sphingomonas]MDR6848581.1 hypothetical protein [Sphingomonas sp. BE137]MDR7255862.1 hypothetical protein [Sphingomonas sp. BE270]
MRLVSLLALASATATPLAATPATAPASPGPVATAAPSAAASAANATTQLPRPPRFRGFAPILAAQPAFADGAAWAVQPEADVWASLARATPATRQAARWVQVRSLIGKMRYPEALGILQVMATDDPDLLLVPAFQLARGATLAGLGRTGEALSALSGPALLGNAEACAWRLRAQENAGNPGGALAEVHCALPTINHRPSLERRPFALAAIRAALDDGRWSQALHWLKRQDAGAEASILRGRAYLGKADFGHARRQFEKVGAAADRGQRVEAALGLATVGIAQRRIAPAAAVRQLSAMRFGWRGDDLERRILKVEFAQAQAAHDPVAMLRTGSTLLRYCNLGAGAGPILSQLQQSLTAMLAPDSKMALPDVAGLFWDYRELTPAGADGDLLAVHLADRLQAAGLYARAAELLQYQLTARASDVAKGPLSVRVATLRILAGDPAKAIEALRNSSGPTYSPAMVWDRQRVEAVALALLGKTDAAFAALAEVPDGAAIRAEILWRRRDWNALATVTAASLPTKVGLSEVAQATILRHAIALAMIGREDKLQALRARYQAAFATLPSAGVFDVLTSPVGKIDSAQISAAMAAIPSASPAGVYADLLASTPG